MRWGKEEVPVWSTLALLLHEKTLCLLFVCACVCVCVSVCVCVCVSVCVCLCVFMCVLFIAFVVVAGLVHECESSERNFSFVCIYSTQYLSQYLSRSSVGHFPERYWTVVTVPCFSVVKSFTSWYALLLLFFLIFSSVSPHCHFFPVKHRSLRSAT